MFIVSTEAEEKTFWSTVTGWAPPSKPGGVKVKFEFDVQFKHIKTDDEQNDATDWTWFQERIIDWKRVVTTEKQDLPFNEHNLRAVFDMQWARLPIIQAYYAEINGTVQKRKN